MLRLSLTGGGEGGVRLPVPSCLTPRELQEEGRLRLLPLPPLLLPPRCDRGRVRSVFGPCLFHS